MNDKNKIEEYYECEYDIECKKNYLYYLAKRNKKLKLDVNFTDLPFNKYYSTTKSKVLSINAYPVLGIGCADSIFSHIIEILKIKEIIMFVLNVIKYIFIYQTSFNFIKKEYGYGRNFIFDIIKRDNWNFGFLKLNKFKLNILIEISIMRKFGYKLKHKKWVTDQQYNNYDELNKYDKY